MEKLHNILKSLYNSVGYNLDSDYLIKFTEPAFIIAEPYFHIRHISSVRLLTRLNKLIWNIDKFIYLIKPKW